MDIDGRLAEEQIRDLRAKADGFVATGYRLELSGYCPECVPEGAVSG